MGHAGYLLSKDTGRRYALETPIWRDPAVTGTTGGAIGGLLDLEWQSSFPIDAIARRPATMWRYREAIPIPVVGERDELKVSLGEGLTPLIDAPRSITIRPGIKLKLDTIFPSGSYKDRGASVMVSHCKRLSLKHVVEDSSGNAGAAFSVYCASAGIACDIFCPAATSPAKLAQVRACGMKLVLVPGTRQDVSDAVWQAAQHTYYVSHAWNPFFFHGTKTFAFEVCEQLGWRGPEAVVIPTGNGTLLLGAWIGFRELVEAKIIHRMPRLIAVQSSLCEPLTRAHEAGLQSPQQLTGDSLQQAATTIAEGIAIANPVRGAQCLRAIRETDGTCISVSDEQVIDALRKAWSAGICMEPTCAAAIAAIEHLPTGLSNVVVAITGHGLKAMDKVAKLLDAH